jgi:hypothetical protein
MRDMIRHIPTKERFDEVVFKLLHCLLTILKTFSIHLSLYAPH